MQTLLLVLVAAALVVAAGETVRAQCRRMLSRQGASGRLGGRSTGSVVTAERWRL